MNANLTWEQSGVLAVVLAASACALAVLGGRLGGGDSGGWRRTGHWTRIGGPLLGEAALVVGLYSVWQFIGARVRNQTAGAYERGQWLLDAEKYVPLPSELSLNHAIMGYPWLVQAANLYYATMHFGAAIALLVWLYLRHRDRYAGVRTVLALFTAISLAVSLVPVAPPRLIAGAGFVDTAEHYGQSVYTATNSVVGPNQLSAMPSVHVGWSVLVGVAVVLVAAGPWRWLALAHPAATMVVVAATANHYWLDGIAAAGLLAVAAGLWWAGLWWEGRRAWRGSGSGPATTPAPSAAAREPQPSTQS